MFRIKIIEAATISNRPVYAIAALYRENFLAKEERFVVSGTVRPGTAGDPRLVSRFLPTRQFCNRIV